MTSVSMRHLKWMSKQLTWQLNALYAMDTSVRVTHIEERLMRINFRAHEAVRWILIRLAEFNPQLDPSHLARRFGDELICYAEAKLKQPGVSKEDVAKASRLIVRVAMSRAGPREQRLLRL